MKKTALLVILLTVINFTSNAQDRDSIIDINQEFRAINLDGAMRVTINPIKENEKSRATIISKGVQSKDLKWEVRNDCLDVRMIQGILNEKAEIEIEIYAHEIRNIKIKGASIESTGVMLSDDMRIETLGSENTINMAIETGMLTIKTSGQSDIKLSGSAERAMVECRAGARVDMLHCPVDKMNCTAGEGAEIYATIDGSIEAKASMNATIYYLGEPKETQLKATLFGAIIPLATVNENAGKKL